MRLSVFGLGYVGCVTAACLAKEGHDVVGVDVNATKVDMVNAGKSPIVENGLDELISDLRGSIRSSSGSLTATDNAKMAVENSEVSLVCTGTPSHPNGNINLEHVRACVREIGTILRGRDTYHLLVARSTLLPGTIEDLLLPELERASARKVGESIGLAVNPEFLREGTSISDFYNPPVTVIGQRDSRSGDLLEKMYSFLKAPVVRTDIRTGEMIKYANNSFHALKVSFANEIGAICKALEIDSHTVMDIFCLDHKLNLSAAYLKPGFAFGGSCLPKDLRALAYKAKQLDIDIPVLSAILPSNRIHIERAVDAILRSGKRHIGILGLSFKAGTDDLRESPVVTLAEQLIGKGLDLRIYDRHVYLASLVGANKAYINQQIPHISSLMVECADAVLDHAELVVVANGSPEFKTIVMERCKGIPVLDLVRIGPDIEAVPELYQSLCW